MTNFQLQPFLFNPTGKAPPTRGRSVKKKRENVLGLKKKEEKKETNGPTNAF